MCPQERQEMCFLPQRIRCFSDRTQYIRRLRGLPELPKAVRVCLVTIIRFGTFGNGELLMVLTDGMGSGEMADRDSSNLIEALEYLMEAGFEKIGTQAFEYAVCCKL